MPFALDTTETVDVWLESDGAKPIDSRPTFTFRHLSKGDLRRVHRQIEDAVAASKAGRHEESDALACAAILAALVGWRNMGSRQYAATQEALESILSGDEIWELATGFPSKLRLSELDRRKGPSPSPGVTAVSATPTGPEMQAAAAVAVGGQGGDANAVAPQAA